jgi:hypothetical protein
VFAEAEPDSTSDDRYPSTGGTLRSHLFGDARLSWVATTKVAWCPDAGGVTSHFLQPNARRVTGGSKSIRMPSQLDLADLEELYGVLTTTEREELLQALLITALRGGHEVTRMLEAYCLARAASEFIADFTGSITAASPSAIQSRHSPDKD